MAGRRMRGVVLVAETEVQVSEGDPGRFAAPPRLDELLRERKQREELLDRLRRALGLEARCEAQPRDLYLNVYARVPMGEGAVLACFRVAIANA
jgi:hypothetical protein